MSRSAEQRPIRDRPDRRSTTFRTGAEAAVTLLINAWKTPISPDPAIPDEGGLGEMTSRSTSASHARQRLPCVSTATRLPPRRSARPSAPRSSSAGFPPDSTTRSGPAGQFGYALYDLLRRQTLGVRPDLGRVDGVHRVAPGAAIVASAEAHEVGGYAGIRTLALNGRAKDLDHG